MQLKRHIKCQIGLDQIMCLRISNLVATQVELKHCLITSTQEFLTDPQAIKKLSTFLCSELNILISRLFLLLDVLVRCAE